MVALAWHEEGVCISIPSSEKISRAATHTVMPGEGAWTKSTRGGRWVMRVRGEAKKRPCPINAHTPRTQNHMTRPTRTGGRSASACDWGLWIEAKEGSRTPKRKRGSRRSGESALTLTCTFFLFFLHWLPDLFRCFTADGKKGLRMV